MGRNYFVSKGCQQKQACMNNQIQNERAAWVPTQCNPLFPSNSVCRCCCSNEDGCNDEDDFCLQPPQCPPLEVRYGLESTCTDDRFVKSTCNFSCKETNQRLVGASQNTCTLNGAVTRWTPEQPECERRFYKNLTGF